MTNCSAFVCAFFAFLVSLHLVNPVNAQDKNTQTGVRTDTLRGASDSLAKLWIAPYIDSNEVSKNWSGLKKGLSQQAVRDLLGRPTSIQHDMQNAFTYWWYGHRSVVFNSITRKVSNWDK